MEIERFLHELGLRGIGLDEVMGLIDSGAHLDSKLRTSNRIGVHGHLKIYGKNAGGMYVLRDQPNLITNKGFQILAFMWGGPDSPETFATVRPFKIAVGDPTTATPITSPTVTQIQLDQEITGARRDIDQRVFLTSGGNTNGVRFELEYTDGDAFVNGHNLSEAGLFPSSFESPYGMIARQTFSPIPKTGSFAVAIHWSFTFTAA